METKISTRKHEVLMLFIATTSTKQYQIEVQENAKQWQVSITELKTQKTQVHCLAKKDYQQFGEVISFIFKNRSYLIDIVTKGNNYSVFTKGSHKTIHLVTEERMLYNKLTQGDLLEKNTNIKSGMPGKIINLCVTVNDTVKQGDLLLVIEAMKMENEIRSHKDGTIKNIYIKKNQIVETGTLLMCIKNL